MRNITPQHLRCPAGYCIGIYEVTPAEMRCTYMASCPAIFAEGGAYLIIGKKVETIPPELLGRIGPDELLIAVPKPLLADVERGGQHPLAKTQEQAAADELHRELLAQIDGLMDAKAGTEDAKRLDRLAGLVERYETIRWPCGSKPECICAEFDGEDPFCALHGERRQERAAHPDVEREWRTIDSAPKDGTKVLICTHVDGEWCVGICWHAEWRGSSGKKQGWLTASGDKPDANPTHWLPLPSPPKPLNEREQG